MKLFLSLRFKPPDVFHVNNINLEVSYSPAGPRCQAIWRDKQCILDTYLLEAKNGKLLSNFLNGLYTAIPNICFSN